MKYYSPKKVCEMLDIHRKTFYEWEKLGKIKVVTINGNKRVSQEEIDRLIKGE